MLIRPHRVLLATIRDKGLCLCPRCFIPKDDLHLMGLMSDMRDRLSKARTYLWGKVLEARDWIYSKGKGIKSKAVEDLLFSTSSVPTEVSLGIAVKPCRSLTRESQNAFIERLGEDFELSRMLAPDFMHEFELGVWKAVLTHLIRILHTQGPAIVAEFDNR